MRCSVVGCWVLLWCLRVGVCYASELFLTMSRSLFSNPLGCEFVTRGPAPGLAGFRGAIQNTRALSEAHGGYAGGVMAQRSHRTGEGLVKGAYWGDVTYQGFVCVVRLSKAHTSCYLIQCLQIAFQQILFLKS